jgi:hypothetical protein
MTGRDGAWRRGAISLTAALLFVAGLLLPTGILGQPPTLSPLPSASTPSATDGPILTNPFAVSLTEPALQNPLGKTDGPLDRKAVEAIIADYIKKKDADKKREDEAKKAEAVEKKWFDLFGGTRYDLQSLYDSLSQPKLDGEKKWYEKLSIRGYTQFRYGRTLSGDAEEIDPNLFGDRSIDGTGEGFSIRRARVILFGDITEHIYIYFQPDFGSVPPGSTSGIFFAQMRDWYADIHLDTTKVHRFRVGLSKVPYGFVNMQSSQNRAPLDRDDAMNTAVAPNERDLGVFYYYTPEEQQKLFRALVESGLKGSGNYGVLGVGVYNGQGGSVFESNLAPHVVARATWPFQLPYSDQVVELSIQGYTGPFTVAGAEIYSAGADEDLTPGGTGRGTSIVDQRVAGTFVWYPQPFGLQCEWSVGRGPGLNPEQTDVVARALYGGYVQAMYRHETPTLGIVTPYCRYQQFRGGYRNVANAPMGHQRQLDLGIEWQIRKALELVLEYSMVNLPDFRPTTSRVPYQDFEGTVLRVQLQVNY